MKHHRQTPVRYAAHTNTGSVAKAVMWWNSCNVLRPAGSTEPCLCSSILTSLSPLPPSPILAAWHLYFVVTWNFPIYLQRASLAFCFTVTSRPSFIKLLPFTIIVIGSREMLLVILTPSAIACSFVGYHPFTCSSQ